MRRSQLAQSGLPEAQGVAPGAGFWPPAVRSPPGAPADTWRQSPAGVRHTLPRAAPAFLLCSAGRENKWLLFPAITCGLLVTWH